MLPCFTVFFCYFQIWKINKFQIFGTESLHESDKYWIQCGLQVAPPTCQKLVFAISQRLINLDTSYLTQTSLRVHGIIGFSLVTRWCHLDARIVFLTLSQRLIKERTYDLAQILLSTWRFLLHRSCAFGHIFCLFVT